MQDRKAHLGQQSVKFSPSLLSFPDASTSLKDLGIAVIQHFLDGLWDWLFGVWLWVHYRDTSLGFATPIPTATSSTQTDPTVVLKPVRYGSSFVFLIIG